LITQNLAVVFPLFFALLWLMVATILSVLSGWFRLMAKFPNLPIEPILRVSRLSGSIGGIGMRGILRLDACPAGLRVGINRMFGPFCRDFFVPWEDIRVTRTRGGILFSQVAKLQFGRPVVGSLTISARVANKLARAAIERWPEAGPFPEETHGETFRRLLVEWAMMTCAAALFFTLVPLAVASGKGGGPPLIVAILFPAITIGVFQIVSFFRERS
jgi:hypothetical protein